MENVMSNFMYIALSLLSLFIDLFFFSKISDKNFKIRDIVLALLIRIPIAFILTIIVSVTDNNFFRYFDYPVYTVILSFLFLKPLSKTLLFFYGLFPPTIYLIFERVLIFFLFPIFGLNEQLLDNFLLNTLVNFLVTFFCLWFLKWLQYDFSRFKIDILDKHDKKLLYLSNFSMIVFHIFMGSLIYFDLENDITTISYRKLIVIIYLIFFIGIINQMNRHLRERVKDQLSFQKDLQLQGMENYNKQIEGLYKNIRNFRHDYINLLTTLRLSIESGDINQVKEIYASVLKDSDVDLKKQKYDFGRLVNINNPALKSLLAIKFIQATETHISLTIDIPEIIEPQKIDLIDFITVVSIFCDNAIEAKPKELSIAYLSTENKHLFIVENTINEETLDISRLYDYGFSTKGEGRGIGLYNVMKIVERYPNVSLKTTARNYHFTQVLEIYL